MNNTKLEERYLIGKKVEINGCEGIYTLIESIGKKYYVFLGSGENKFKIEEYIYLYDARYIVATLHSHPLFTAIAFKELNNKGEQQNNGNE